MSETQKKTFHLKKSTEALQAAVANLEKFAHKDVMNPTVNVADLTVKEGQLVAKASSPLKKTIELARCFITATFSGKARAKYKENKIQVRKALLQAIDTVKQNHLIIEKLREGTLDEQRFAASTIAAIERYNTVLDETGTKKKQWGNRIARFFYKFSGLSVDDELKTHRIELPQSTAQQSSFPQQDSNMDLNFDDKISPAFHANVAASAVSSRENCDPILKLESDAIRIKANTLIRQQGGACFQSISEALTSVRNAPIQAMLDTESSTSTLYMTLNVIPGMVVKVKGSFKRNVQANAHSCPISDSFQLAWKSIQSGFPHPSQYSGWALADPLIPSYPHHLDLLPILEPLYRRKQEAALTLLPGGRLFEPAKHLMRLKAEVFEKNAQEWIHLHKELSLAILEAVPQDLVPQDGKEIIEAFYAHLVQENFPLRSLAEIYQTINVHAIIAPHAALQEKWLSEQESQGVVRPLQVEEEKSALEIKMPEWSIDFIHCFDKILSASSQAILLQHLSETFRLAPPMLSDFQYKLQTAAFKQLSQFLEELEWNLQVMPHSEALACIQVRVRNQLLADIALFKAASIDELDPTYSQFSQELEIYFNSRFYLMT